jgi:lipoprotein signal peptidase
MRMAISKQALVRHAYLLPALMVFSADQLLKRWEVSHLRLLARKPIAGMGWFTLSRFHNNGLAGSKFSNLAQSELNVWTKYAPTGVTLLLVLFFARRLRHAGTLEKAVSLALIAAGISNLWDNWRQSFVVDTFALNVGFGTFVPVNIADMVIVGSCAVLCSLFIRELFSTPLNGHYEE